MLPYEGVIRFEIPKSAGMELNQDCDDLAFTQFCRSYPLPFSAFKQVFVPDRLEDLPEVIDSTEQFE